MSAPTVERPVPEQPPRRLPRVAVVFFVLAVLIGAAALILPRLRPHIYAGTVLQSPGPAPAVGLADHTGRVVDLDGYRGDVVLIYFGYTNCPDLCPVTLSTIALARAQLDPALAERVHTLMVTVDPEHDTPELLGPYVTRFDPTFLGVGGTTEEVIELATVYGVYFAPNDEELDARLVDHTSTLMAIDPDGHLRIVYPTGLEAADLATDLERLLG